MAETLSKQQLMDIKTDMKLLLECMTYQKDNPSALKQALVTLSSSLQSCNEAKDIFRDTGGLQSVLDTVTSTRYGEVTEAGLYCLGSAVERNVYSQKLLSTASTFTFIHSILGDVKGTSVRKKRTAAFMILCLVSNNGFGQNLARESSCLHDVLSLIRTSLPKSTSESSSEWLDRLEGTSVALWSTLVSTACVCVNNPLNEENQRICASLLPYLFSLLEEQPSHSITRPILSLVGLTVANNAQNQDRVRKCGGLDTFLRLLEKLVSKIESDPNCKTTAIHLLNTLDSAISDNEENAINVGKLGAITLMLKMLSASCLEDQDKTQIILTLAHAADICEENRHYIKDSGGITSLIQQLTLTENEELSKTVKYLLHMCVTSDREVTIECDENNNLPEVEPMVAKMERMKKQNDLQMLEKINELDEKLRCMEKEALDRQGSVVQLISVGDGNDSVKESSSHEYPEKKSTFDCTLPLSKERELQGTPMTPRETSLLVQLHKEKKEKHKLETLNQMLQENMHMCLTKVASRGDCSHVPYAGLEKRTATIPTLTSAGDGCHYQPTFYNDEETLAEKFVEGSIVISSAKMSVENNNHYENLKNAKNDCSVCSRKGYSKDRSNTNPQIQKNGKNRGTNDKTLYSKQSCTDSLKPNSDFLNSQVCGKETYYAEPLHRVNKNQIETTVRQNDADNRRNAHEKLRNVVDSDMQDAGVQCFHKQTCNKSSQNYEQNSFQNLKQNTNIQTCRKFVCDSPNQSSSISEVVQDNTDFNNNDISCENRNNLRGNVNCHVGNNTLEVQTRQSLTQSLNEKQRKILHGRNSSNSVDTNANEIEMYGKQQQYTTYNIDRVLQTDPLQPFVRLERISVANKGHSTMENEQDVCGTVPDASHKNSDNTDTILETLHKKNQNINTSHVSEFAKTEATANEFPKEKAKRVLLGYTRAVSKSTCTTPSLSKIAAEQQQSLVVENSLHTVSGNILPSKKSQLQQTDREKTEIKKVLPAVSDKEISGNKDVKLESVNGDAISNNEPSNQVIDSCTPVKAKTVLMDNTNTFVKPSAVAPRRKFRMTPQLGSSKLPKTAHSNTKSQVLDSDQSDVESEFDFKLLKTAKQKRQKQFSSQSDCDNFSQLSTDSLTKQSVEDYKTKCLPKSLPNRCAVWSVLPVSPKKRPCVPTRPAFSDCGSRRPVFESPMSVKSVGKLRKRGLDDSGIYSPGNTLNISPGGTSLSGSCDSLSTIDAYFDEQTDDRHRSIKDTKSSKQIALFNKQDKCPGCQERLRGGRQFLNSRTYNIALETDPNTCSFHRKLRNLERMHIQQLRKKECKKATSGRLLDSLKFRINRGDRVKKKPQVSVYELESDGSERLSPPSCFSDEDGNLNKNVPAKCKRRKRQEYTEEEEENLLEGVRKMGKSWTQILATYQFHLSRTAVDLKDKYKTLMKSTETKSTHSSVVSRSFKPFSMCEERRLRRGIKKFGYSWKAILEKFTFSRGRTAEDLRNRWRCMHKKTLK